MEMRPALGLLVIGSCVALAACPGGDDTARIVPLDFTIAHEDIERLRSDYVAAAHAGDADRLAQLFSPHAVLSLPGEQPIRGRDAIRDVLQRDLARFGSLQLVADETRITSDWAYDSGSVTQAWTGERPAGAPEQFQSTYAALIGFEVDGTWRIRRLVVSSDVPLPGSGGAENAGPQKP
jgi:uncharacterized protein (TIGR02246 family)